MTTDIIKCQIPDITVAFEPLIVAERDSLRERASTILKVETDTQNDLAVRTAQGIKRLLKSIEKDEKKTRAAFEDCKDKVRLELRKFTAIMDQEYERLVQLTSDYDLLRCERLRKEEEAHRLKIEANLAAEAKAKADAEAALRLALVDTSDIDSINAALEAADNAQKLKLAAEEALRVELPKIEKAQGQVTRVVTKWEILDLEKVFAAKPHWFERVVKRSVVNEEVTKHTILDGLKVWEETERGIRV